MSKGLAICCLQFHSFHLISLAEWQERGFNEDHLPHELRQLELLGATGSCAVRWTIPIHQSRKKHWEVGMLWSTSSDWESHKYKLDTANVFHFLLALSHQVAPEIPG